MGDLVNRGPRSLEVLRWARRMGPRVVTVLGNHDLHLIGRALGVRREKPKDTLDDVLRAPDRFELVDWLRRRPLVYRRDGHLLVHAGLHPAWSARDADRLAREAEAVLRGGEPEQAVEALRRKPPAWKRGLARRLRVRLAIQTFTSLRACAKSGRSCEKFSGRPEDAPRGCRPWFEVPTRRSTRVTVVCGHWSALGLYVDRNVISLDTGCVWGRALTAVRLPDRALFQEPYAD